MYSFGYKNLYTPKPNKPGPGDYEITDRSLKKLSPKLSTSFSEKKKLQKQNDKTFQKLKNHENCYQEYYTRIENQKFKKVKHQSPHYFTASKRSDYFTLPQISKGPQYYVIDEKKLDHSIDIGKFSSRKSIFDQCELNYSTEKCKRESKNYKQLEQKKSFHQFRLSFNNLGQLVKSVPKFRDYSFIEKEKRGPSLITPPKEATKGATFNRSPRFENPIFEFRKTGMSKEKSHSEDSESESSVQVKKEKASEQLEHLKEQRKISEKYFFNRAPQYPFSLADQNKLSYFNRSTEVIKSKMPGPGEYIQKSESGKPITFSKAQRSIEVIRQEIPGPGEYAEQSERGKPITFTKAQRSIEVQKSELPGPGEYAQKSDRGKLITFSKAQRSKEVRKSEMPGPGEYVYKSDRGKPYTFSKAQRF